MTNTITRTPRTLSFGGQNLQVEELSARLPFTRKPADLGALSGGEQQKVYVTETKELTTAEFDVFACNLLKPCDWLHGKGGGSDSGYLCVEVTAPGRPYLYINPEGSNYARYVARLG